MSVIALRAAEAAASAARITAAICGLPAVAASDWCDRAAACFSTFDGADIQVASIIHIDNTGSVGRVEAAGLAITRPQDATGDAHTIDSTLRQRLAAGIMPRLFRGQGSVDHQLFGNAATVFGPDFSASDSSLWGGIGVHALAVAGVPLRAESPDRILLIQLASLRPESPLDESATPVLQAVVPILARRALIAFGQEASSPTAWLTDREQAVLEHLALGKSVRQIAEETGRSPHTVHDHVKSLHRKLQASSRGELIARALGHVDRGQRIRDRSRA